MKPPTRDIITDNFIRDIFQPRVDINNIEKLLIHSLPLALDEYVILIDTNENTKLK